MTGDREEPNRVLGFPVRRAPSSPAPVGGAPPGRAPSDGDAPDQDASIRPAGESQRVLGFSAEWVDQVVQEALRPIREARRRLQRRNPGRPPGPR
jgi:hypothetical protein